DKRNAVDYLKKTNFVHVQITAFGSTPADCQSQRENLPAAATREQVVQHLLRTLYPASLIQEHLASRSADLVGKKVNQVEADYCNTLTYPMLMTHSVFHDAIHGLVEQGNVLGLRHPAGNYCGERPRLNGDQLGEGVISEPFDITAAPSTAPTASTTAIRPAQTTLGGPLGSTAAGSSDS